MIKSTLVTLLIFFLYPVSSFSQNFTFFQRNHARLISDPGTLYDLQVNLIRTSKEIRIAQYNWANDIYGNAMLYELIKALNKGAKVSILIDGAGSDSPRKMFPDKMQSLIINAGGEVKIFKRKKIFTLRPVKNNRGRLHDKSFIADKYLIIGGSNIGKSFQYMQSKLIDANMLIKGPAVQNAVTQFDTVFKSSLTSPGASYKLNTARFIKKMENDNKMSTGLLDNIRNVPLLLSNDIKHEINSIRLFPVDLKYISDAPKKNNFGTNKELMRMLKSAKTSIRLITPYPFFPTRLKKLFDDKIKEGVYIEILTPRPKDYIREYTGLYGAFLDQLDYYKNSHIDFNIFKTEQVHSKILIVDTQTAYVGGHNFDIMSFDFNTENGVIIKDNSSVFNQVLNFYNNRKLDSELAFSEGKRYLIEQEPCHKPLPLIYTNTSDTPKDLHSDSHRCMPYWVIYPNLSKGI